MTRKKVTRKKMIRKKMSRKEMTRKKMTEVEEFQVLIIYFIIMKKYESIIGLKI